MAAAMMNETKIYLSHLGSTAEGKTANIESIFLEWVISELKMHKWHFFDIFQNQVWKGCIIRKITSGVQKTTPTAVSRREHGDLEVDHISTWIGIIIYFLLDI